MFNTLLTYTQNFLRGKLTYFVAWTAIVGTAISWSQGLLDDQTALLIINANLALVGIRRAVSTS